MPSLSVIEPHGFCMGVTTAVRKANEALESHRGETVYCLHELVHNELVTGDLAGRGMVFVNSLDEVPDGAVTLFSAHGVGPAVRRAAEKKGLRTIDATCPFVSRVHRTVKSYAECGMPVVIVGKSNHAEVIGTEGEALDAADDAGKVVVVENEADVAKLQFGADEKIGVVTQTTFSSDEIRGITAALRAKYANLVSSPAADICTATADRQRAVRDFVRCAKAPPDIRPNGRAGAHHSSDRFAARAHTLAHPSGSASPNVPSDASHLRCISPSVDIRPPKVGIVVLGSAKSSNTKRLAEIASLAGADEVMRIGCADEFARVLDMDVDVMGVTSGASTPEKMLLDFLDFMNGNGK